MSGSFKWSIRCGIFIGESVFLEIDNFHYNDGSNRFWYEKHFLFSNKQNPTQDEIFLDFDNVDPKEEERAVYNQISPILAESQTILKYAPL